MVRSGHAKFHTKVGVKPNAYDMETSGQDKTEPDSRNSKLHYGNNAQGPMPQEVSDLCRMCVTSLLHPAPSRTPSRIPTIHVGNRRAGLRKGVSDTIAERLRSILPHIAAKNQQTQAGHSKLSKSRRFHTQESEHDTRYTPCSSEANTYNHMVRIKMNKTSIQGMWA